MPFKPIVVITGASSGIGLAIGSKLQEKYEVINISRNTSPFHNIYCDLEDTNSLSIGLTNLLKYLDNEKIHYLINNAGTMPLECDSLDLFKKVISVNLQSAYVLSVRLVDIIEKGIINISSVSAVKCASPDDSIAYGISKAGLNTLTKYLAVKYPNLCVNSILPGFIKNTNLVPGATPKELVDTIPKKKEGNTTDISNLVSYLIEQDYITGQEIAVDGGLSL